MIKKLLTILVLVVSLLILPSQFVLADSSNPAQLFETNCAGCHAGGGNIIRRGKNLKMRALRRNKLDSTEAIIDLVTNGKNNMPAYQGRLSEREIKAVSVYVLQQAEINWK